MKKLILATLALSTPLLAFAEIEEITYMPEKVFAANGFDDNDQSQITLHGRFPDSCYHAGAASFKVEGNKIVVTNKAFHQKGTPCMDVLVPWTTTVNLGVLPSGKYDVEMLDASEKRIPTSKMTVNTAKSVSIDDYLYAYVNGLNVKLDPEKRTATVTISGTFGMTCLYIKELRVIRDESDTVVLLPIMDIFNPEGCAYPYLPIPYEKTMTIEQPLMDKHTLIHVRSMNGQALNQVVEL